MFYAIILVWYRIDLIFKVLKQHSHNVFSDVSPKHKASTSILSFFLSLTFSFPNLSSKWSFSVVFLDSSTLWTPAPGLSGGLQIQPVHPVRSFWTQWMILLKISSSVAVDSLGQFLNWKSRSNLIEKKKNPHLFIDSFWTEHSLIVILNNYLCMYFIAVLLQESHVQIWFLSLDERITQSGAKTFKVKRSGLIVKTNMKSPVLSLNPMSYLNINRCSHFVNSLWKKLYPLGFPFVLFSWIPAFQFLTVTDAGFMLCFLV